MEKLFGGNPIAVLLRLVVLSIIVGVIMSALDIRPDNILYHLQIIGRRIYDLGFGAFEWLFQYLLIGALVVVPIWLIVRLVNGLSGKSNDPKS